ncbi:hypothetical protein ED28_09070 [[Pantoea] beijingensis]|uniref:SnoaL-like domain-containing protein n=1 Tax=[Pantoea] beijingensis TaxID=1324864 RepID=A0A443ID54_9GAMM|nr:MULTISPECIES: nuclear transport factor 2 family protein [Erwiniaceae]RWR02211.1 hypothetical protein ED28_09070 [[Pantoea] beijingensis]
MSTEINKQVAQTYFAALGRYDIDGMRACMTDDATWWIVPGTSFSGLHPKETFLSYIPKLFDGTVGRLDFEPFEITAEDNRVIIVTKGNLQFNDGRVYASNYCFVLTFRDGKIVSGKEFLDPIHVNEIFGGPES